MLDRAKLLVLLVLLYTSATALRSDRQTRKGISRHEAAHTPLLQLHTYSNLPMSFERNQGQTDESVKFLSRGRDYSLFLTPTEAVLTSSKGSQPKVLRLQLTGSNSLPRITGVDQVPGATNYFIGNDPNKWHTNIPTYGKVHYSGVYRGIDLVYYGHGSELEYDFVVAPGADLNQIRLHFEGAQHTSIDGSGDLVLETQGDTVKLFRPTVHQMVAGNQQVVTAQYVLKDNNEIEIKIGHHDDRETLIIDPVLSYSTYLGGSITDEGYGIAVDDAGCAYTTGMKISPDFPATSSGTGTIGQDVFVSKLNATGSALVYSTYFGGSNTERGLGITVDSTGQAYVAGQTNSVNFPTVNALQGTNNGGTDAFVTKLDQTGSVIVYSTYIGGSSFDNASSIALDKSGNAYVTGQTDSSDFPTASPLQSTNHGNNAFVSKLNPQGSALQYSTYLGGSNSEMGYGIVVDAGGNAYVAGTTKSPDFPTVNPLQSTYGGVADAFVSKLNPAGSALVFSTFLGGSNDDAARAIAIDPSGNVFITGDTFSLDLPVVNPVQAVNHGGSTGFEVDAFVAKLNSTGSALLYGTYLGGSDTDSGYAISVDASGQAYVTGLTGSADFPTANPLQSSLAGAGDVFIAKFSASGSTLIYSTFLGGSGIDRAYGLALDASGGVYIAGYTASIDFPVVNPLQNTNNGTHNVFVAKVTDGIASIPKKRLGQITSQ